MKIGSHVGMSGKEMMLGSVKEALSYGANTFMLYTGAPQNTRRKDVSELHVEEAWELMRANDITEFVVHAPYIINLANTVKPEIYQLAVDFLKTEIERTAAMGSHATVQLQSCDLIAIIRNKFNCYLLSRRNRNISALSISRIASEQS